MIYTALHLEPGESVIYEVRKHWIVFVGYGLVIFVVAIMPLVALTFFNIFGGSVLDFSLSSRFYVLFSFFYTLWLMTLWVFFFIDWTKYYLDVWYVTQNRIIIINQKKLFDREISNIRFDRVQDVSVNVDGVVATFLDFGNIQVQTASEDNVDFSISTVRHPGEVRKIIFSQHNASKPNHQHSGLGNTTV